MRDKICPIMSKPKNEYTKETGLTLSAITVIYCQKENCRLWVDKDVSKMRSGHCGLIKEE